MMVSVVIPTRNRRADLIALVKALESQTRLPDEVLVVDSSDDPVTALGSLLSVRVIRSGPGACRQRNLGARESKGDLLFFFDDDVRPRPDFIALMAETFEGRPEYDGGMGTLKATMSERSVGSLLCRLFMLQHEHGDGRFYPSGMPRHPYGTLDFKDIEVMGAGLMAVRRSVFTDDRVVFDERLTLSQQDTDFSWRLSRRRRLFFDPRAVVEHELSPVGRPKAIERGRRYMFNYRYLFFKNVLPSAPWSRLAHWWAVLGMFVVAAATGAGGLLLGYAAGYLDFLAFRLGLSPGRFEPAETAAR